MSGLFLTVLNCRGGQKKKEGDKVKLSEEVGQGRLPGRDNFELNFYVPGRFGQRKGDRSSRHRGTKLCDILKELQVIQYYWSRSGILGG